MKNEFIDFKPNTVSVDGRNLFYYEAKSNYSSTILFIHGNSLSANSFRAQLHDQLLPFRCIEVDLPGHGRSSKADTYSLPFFAQVLHSFIEALDLKDVHLVGHSLGGHIALNLLNNPRVKAATIFGSPPLKKPLDSSAFLENAIAPLMFKSVSNTGIETAIAIFERSKSS